MNLLVTGAAGFLGSCVVDSFQNSHSVIGVYNRTRPIGSAAKFIQSLDELQITPDVIILCHAAVSAGSIQRTLNDLEQSNVEYTKEVATRFPNVPTVYISTVSVYESADDANEDSPVNPQTAYAQTKLEGEKIVLQNPKSAIVRLSSLYGAGMKPGTLIPNYVNQALETGSVDVWGMGTRKQNYIHVLDVVNLLDKIMSGNHFGQQIYLGTSNGSHSNLEVAQIVSGKTGSAIRFVNQDASKSASYDNSFTRKSLNWEPRINLEDGISGYIDWLKKQS